MSCHLALVLVGSLVVVLLVAPPRSRVAERVGQGLGVRKVETALVVRGRRPRWTCLPWRIGGRLKEGRGVAARLTHCRRLLVIVCGPSFWLT